MIKNKIAICDHIKQISRQTLQKTVATIIQRQCHLHQNLPLYYICLHCTTSICLQYEGHLTCLQSHNNKHQDHMFYLQFESGSVWCQNCKDTIQNQLFQSDLNDKDESIMKLKRFESYIKDIWSKVGKKNEMKILKPSLRGLKNLGNTCYLNVSLQVLFASKPLRELYKKIEIKDEKLLLKQKIIPKQIQYFYDDVLTKKQSQSWNIVTNKKQKQKQQRNRSSIAHIKNSKFNILLNDFLEQMSKKEQQNPYSPSKILSSLSELNMKYCLKQQQDADQLLLLMIDVLNEGERISLIRDPQRYKQIQNILGFQKLSPIQHIFGFYLVNQTQCNQCKEISYSNDLSYNLSISSQKVVKQQYAFENKSVNIKIDYWEELQYPEDTQVCSLLSQFFKIERLTKAQNYYQCQKCKSLLAYRRYFLLSQPKILIINIKKFTSKFEKKHEHIDFPEQLNLKGIILDKHANNYSLFAIIVHQGSSIKTGHYICFIRIQDQWYLCSDQNIQLVSWKQVKTQQPYILLYQQMQKK